MLYFITDKEKKGEFVGYTCTVLSSFSKLLEYEFADDDILVIHSSIESTETAALCFRRLDDLKNIKVYYINAKPDEGMVMLVKSIGGVIVEDEYFLKHIDEIPSDGIESGISKKDISNSFSFLKNAPEQLALNRESGGGLTVAGFPAAYKKALDNIDEALKTSSQQYKNLSKAYIQMLDFTVKMADEFGNKLTDIERSIRLKDTEISRLNTALQASEEVANSQSQTATNIFGGNVHFPIYNYNGKKTIIVFKEFTATRYLTYFVLGLHRYLKTQGKHVKTLILDSPEGSEQHRYKKLFKIDSSNYSTGAAYSNDVAVIAEQSKTILDTQFQTHNNVFLVIDRMYRSEFFIKGPYVENIYALSGQSEYEDVINQLPSIPDPINVLVPLIGSSKWTTIGHIQSFSKQDDNGKLNYCLAQFKDVYPRYEQMIKEE